MKIKALKIASLCLILAISTACSTFADKYDDTSGWSQNKLYEEGQSALSSKDYGNAAKYFELFEGRYPLSAQSKQALINSAYAYHKNDDKQLAMQTVERFIQLYPNDDLVEYAYYLRGLIFFNDNLGVLGRFVESNYSERDPQSMRTSYSAFKSLIERFPNSKYTPDTLQRMRFIVNSLAEHDLKIAKYYYKRGAYLAAVNRAEQLIKLYDRAPAIEEALFIMAKCYELLNMKDLSTKSKETLSRNFSNSKFLKQL